MLRSEGNPLDLAASIREAVREVRSDAAIDALATLDSQVSASVAQPRFAAAVVAGFAALAVLLSAIGLYSVLAYTVSRRTREIGLRMALGAERGRVLWLVLKEVAVLSCAGVIAGLAGAFYLTRHVESQLFGIAPNDPATLAAAVGLLLVIALLAGWMPARRATRIDPMLALRYE